MKKSLKRWTSKKMTAKLILCKTLTLSRRTCRKTLAKIPKQFCSIEAQSSTFQSLSRLFRRRISSTCTSLT